MPEILIVTAKQPGVVWPFVRGIFAVIGLGAVLGFGTGALRDGVRAYHATAFVNPVPAPHGNPFADAPPGSIEPLPNTALGIEFPDIGDNPACAKQ
jgi:hypothetical protein